ncbi:Rrf2 family transcriptional regulator [Lactobacillus koreensis] [Lactiplantibacillus mudanjiangensis]|uniref:Rrf2 family transcriptional regulator n=1 Tax=Lactiplantibacillus mudanjiangensis TaxID=1296538 RepID=UPI0010155E74|nr:Rrf2 family transcriptional regulator [Lactiplantibacillus mudanjiangensis]VDG19522.1 Rrf2 family transcriptional regulator [Lactobacillus koreensis] [Lactiplantibacillus mudanjiangensis]VDG30972.1 Rrf2 family transcriptional regulator [Lactobacillus koreensis] [Lactiplantibacillus mudanjiangensis]
MANTQFSDTIHVLVYIAYFKGNKITSHEIASSLETSPSLIRKIIANLKREQLLAPVQGPTKLALSRDPSEITLQDIYRTLPGQAALLNVDNHTSAKCPIGEAMPPILTTYYQEIQAAAEAKMAKITLQDLLNDVALRQRLTS